MIRASAIVLISGLFVAGCGAPESTELDIVSVRVLRNHRDCVVSDQPVACNDLPSYLKNEMKLRSDTMVSLNPEEVGPPGEDVRNLSERLKEAGFEQVAVVGFNTLPEPNNAFQRTLEDSRR
jgi:hypothetical protein